MFYPVSKYIPFLFLQVILYINVIIYVVLNDSISYPIYIKIKKVVVGLMAKDTTSNINPTRLLTEPLGWC